MRFRWASSTFPHRSSIWVTSVVSILLALPPQPLADTLSAAAVHDRIAQLGVGRRVNVEERTGIVVTGKIATIGQESFTLRLSGVPNPLLLRYEDVAGFQRAGPHGSTIFLFSAIGAAAAFTIWAAVHFHNQQKQLPTLPTLPSVP
jgi:hypothetical protein